MWTTWSLTMFCMVKSCLMDLVLSKTKSWTIWNGYSEVSNNFIRYFNVSSSTWGGRTSDSCARVVEIDLQNYQDNWMMNFKLVKKQGTDPRERDTFCSTFKVKSTPFGCWSKVPESQGARAREKISRNPYFMFVIEKLEPYWPDLHMLFKNPNKKYIKINNICKFSHKNREETNNFCPTFFTARFGEVFPGSPPNLSKKDKSLSRSRWALSLAAKIQI